MDNSTLVKAKIIGETPLLMNSDRAVDPVSNDAQWIAELSKKRKKTEEDHIEMHRRSWHVALYQKGGRVYYPLF